MAADVDPGLDRVLMKVVILNRIMLVILAISAAAVGIILGWIAIPIVGLAMLLGFITGDAQDSVRSPREEE